jgi:hypothetical protein
MPRRPSTSNQKKMSAKKQQGRKRSINQQIPLKKRDENTFLASIEMAEMEMMVQLADSGVTITSV